MKKAVTAILILIFLVSCKSAVLNKITLPELDVIDRKLDSYQLISYTRPGSDEVFSCEGSVFYDGLNLDIFLFAPTGQTIARLCYDGNLISTESSLIDNKAAPYIITDILLVYGCDEKIKNYLIKSGYEISFNENNGTKIRTITKNRQIIYTITYCDNIITIDNLYRHYSYSIEEL